MIITVAGQHRATHPPELGTILVRIALEDDDAAAAMAALTREAEQLSTEIAALREATPSPVTASSVQAPGTRSWRPWNEHGEVLPARHEASVSASVTFDDAAALAETASRWGERDGWSVADVVWSLTDEVHTRLEAAALQEAVADARRRAEAIAAACGSGAVRVLDIADAGLLPGLSGAEAQGEALAMRAMAKDSADGVAVAPDDVEVLVRLHARFEA
ncbi:MAG: SIMPL domain-containing protein [Micrococcus sp.]|nr:SIMPL domain-containing protein [Micrococcus sp.]